MSQKFFEIIPSGTKIDFIGKSKYVFMASMAMIGVLTVSLLTRGLNYGVDFTGGTELHLRFLNKPNVSELRSVLKPIGFEDAMVQSYGEENGREFLIRVEPQELNLQSHQKELQKALNSVTSAGQARIRFSEERMYVTYPSEVQPEEIETALRGLREINLQVDSVNRFGQSSANEYLVAFEGVASRIVQAFRQHFGTGKFEVLQNEQVGAKVGSELRMQAIGAVLISIVLILIYVWFRFDLEFAPGAVIALVHDALAVLGIFSVFQLRFDLSTVAAILTIVGFSINDTIVIYDRIRENLKKTKDVSLPLLINNSINETLGRTILTTGTVLLTTLSLVFLGGPITFNFALAFTVGLVSGAYSTIYVASPITIYFHNYITRKRTVR